ncbi:DNA cross-link repair protein PSO2 [Sporobolomyces salmoneus]|uniref:DNA cross-link repair protein PSO2 n=1 Tax=Sporobolomyces salmoneus TaxID=183962 RepID=UPI00317A3182
MVKTPRSKASTSTLDTFVRPTPSPSSTSTASIATLKRPSSTSSATTNTTQKKKEKKVASTPNSGNKKKPVQGGGGKKKVRKPLIEDNRNLGTLELLDSSDEDAASLVVAGLKRSPDEDKEKEKGKGKMVLEEEDWMMNDDNKVDEKEKDKASQEEDRAAAEAKKKVFGSWKEIKPVVVASTSKSVILDGNGDGSSATAKVDSQVCVNRSAEQAEVKTKKEVTNGKGKGKEKETIELSSDDDEYEDDLQVEGGLTCPVCRVDLETLPVQKRNVHVGSCLDTPPSHQSTTSTDESAKPSLLERGLLAPISRLFSRQPTASTSSSTSKPAPSPSTSKPLTSRLPNAFTALMAGHLESTQWKQADQASLQKGRLPKGTDRKVPFYKWIDGMEITVDAFRYGKIEGCKGYFLSHAHSDHYQNLSASWQHGPIYCSLTTANLIKLKLNVDDKWVIPLPLNETVKVQGIDVTLIDANHCPGSVLFLFEGPHTDPSSPYSKTPSRIFRHLHCGDFRASPAHILHPSLSFPHPAPPPIAALLPAALKGRTPKKLDSIYLDTTYLSPSYCFPAQELVIQACADLVRERVVEGREEALWRADGREGERKGIKGWLNGKDVKSEGGAKEEFEMLDSLPEEREEEGEGLGLGGEESMARKGSEEDEEEEGDDDGAEEWKMIREMEEESQSRDQTPAPREEGEFGYLETGGGGNDDENATEGLEEVPTVTEEQIEQDIEFALDNSVKTEEKMEEDSKVPLEPKMEGEEEEKPSLALDDEKPDLVVADEKSDLKPDLKPAKNERLLVMIGTYSIGKERIVKAIAHALSTKIYADPRKKELFLAQDDPDLHSLLTDDPLEAQVHVGWLSSIAREAMLDYLAKYKAPRCEGGFNKMIGLRPTGWTYRSESKDKFPSIPKILQLEQSRKFSPAGLYPQRDSTPQCMAFGVPYSEHSSFFELTCFCLSLDYVRIIPTVNVHNVNSRNKMKEWIDRWAAEKKRRQDARMPKVVPYRNVNYW